MTSTIDQRRELCSSSVTLDGRPASISGAALPFAHVRDDDGRDVEYAWETVARIVAAGGRFHR